MFDPIIIRKFRVGIDFDAEHKHSRDRRHDRARGWYGEGATSLVIYLRYVPSADIRQNVYESIVLLWGVGFHFLLLFPVYHTLPFPCQSKPLW